MDPFGLAAYAVLLEYGNSNTQALYDWAVSYQPANYNTVVIHGSPNGQFSESPGGYSTVSPESIAQYLKSLKGYDPKLPTQLVACTAGASKTGAQALANALGTLVLAPQQILTAGPTPGSPPQAYSPNTFWGTLFLQPPPPPIIWIPFQPQGGSIF